MNKEIRTILMMLSLIVVFIQAGTTFAQCTIGVTSISFSNYDVFSNAPVDSAGTVSISCSKDIVKAFVTLGTSSNSGMVNPRRMKRSGGNDLLDYNIFSDVTRTAVVGNTPIEFRRPSGKPAPWGESFSIYARIPPGQDVSVGSYSDSVSVSVDW
jgi:spore coat protein U-like protein